MMRLWSHEHSGQSVSALVFLYCIWIVSTVVWNTYYKSFPIPGLIDISIDRMAFALLFSISVFQVLLKRIDVRSNRSIELAIVIFCLVCISSMSVNGFNAQYANYPRPFYLFLFGYLVPFFAFFFVKYFVTNQKNIKLIFTTLLLLGAYLSVTAVFERNELNSLVFPRYITSQEFTMHLDRARGPFLNAAFNGMGMIFGFIAGVILLPSAGIGKRICLLGLLALYFPGIYYTHTRSVYLIFCFVLSTLLFFYKPRFSKWKFIPMLIVICISIVAANSKKIFSDSREGGGIAQMEEVLIRFKLIERSERLFFEHPLFGVGLAKFASTDSSPEFFQEKQHNHIIGLAVELGLIGVISYLIIIALVFTRLFSLASNLAITQFCVSNGVIMLTLIITANLINNVFVEPSYCPFVNIVTYSFMGLIDRMRESPELLRAIFCPAQPSKA